MVSCRIRVKLTAGEYKTILQLVTVLKHGKEGKHLTDRVINVMDGVQNLRKAVYECVFSAQLRAPSSELTAASSSRSRRPSRARPSTTCSCTRASTTCTDVSSGMTRMSQLESL